MMRGRRQWRQHGNQNVASVPLHWTTTARPDSGLPPQECSAVKSGLSSDFRFSLGAGGRASETHSSFRVAATAFPRYGVSFTQFDRTYHEYQEPRRGAQGRPGGALGP